eukprot:1154747-Pelagomonas_calceolata.AAC.1
MYICRGFVLAIRRKVLNPSSRSSVSCQLLFELRVVVLEVAVPVLKGQSATVHAHVAREVGHISSLIALLSPKTGEVTKTKPSEEVPDEGDVPAERPDSNGRGHMPQRVVSRGVLRPEAFGASSFERWGTNTGGGRCHALAWVMPSLH